MEGMRPSELYHQLGALISEACGCTIMWDTDDATKQPVRISADQAQTIRLKLVDYCWPDSVMRLEETARER